MKVTEDGFIWRLITPTVAKELFKIIPVYRLHTDDSEGLVKFKRDIKPDGVYGLEVGFVNSEDTKKILDRFLKF